MKNILALVFVLSIGTAFGAVDDSGTEVLKKAAEQVVPGNAGDYYLKTSDNHVTAAAPIACRLSDGADWLDTTPVSGTVSVTGTVAVTGTFWQATQPVSGTFWQATQPVSGSVSVSNFPSFPATQTVDGTVDVGNFPATQTIAGSVSVSNFPATQPVSGTFWQATQPVSGTFWQATQPVSGPLTDSELRATDVDVNLTNASVPVTGTFWQATQPVSGTFWQATQPISAAALPLPSGAATAAKQPALGTAGTPSADVISVQGVASMTALKVDGSAVTQPVSGTFWQATQPVSGTVTVNGPTMASATLSNVSGSNSTQVLLASNASRKGAIFFNDSIESCYVAFAATATSSAFTHKMAPGSFWEFNSPIYTGVISGIWTGINGAMRVTELQ